MNTPSVDVQALRRELESHTTQVRAQLDQLNTQVDGMWSKLRKANATGVSDFEKFARSREAGPGLNRIQDKVDRGATRWSEVIGGETTDPDAAKLLRELDTVFDEMRPITRRAAELYAAGEQDGSGAVQQAIREHEEGRDR